MNLLDNTPNQPSKFRIKNWVEINGESYGMYNRNNQVKFKAMMIKPRSCDYGQAYVLVKKTIYVEALAIGGGDTVTSNF